ncbi:dynein light intermediate chain 1, cytosolic [Entomortierella parvispora]|uniref:Dynein light intermediate chain 1, cytosolic n=1 Tax=Entomortierella parvispora TaxID=205924 RepID=A0A9P3HFE1_9FUNG|nr:dynein light intermediate chain 1, cytosolic [Entomortierella parvispora]
MATTSTASATGQSSTTATAAVATPPSNGGLANGANHNNLNSTSSSTEVWSSLLKSVASSRLVPTKDVIILGDPQSGKSTLIDLLKTAQSTSLDPSANGLDGSLKSGANGVGATGGVVGPNGAVNGGGVTTASNNGNGSAPVMVEMGTGTSEDHMFAVGQRKNDLALSYSFWNVEDDENEETVARLGIYQIAGSHKSYHALLKYCLNTKTVADSVVMIVLDWSRPWTFMETLERWIKVLEVAIEQIRQEGAISSTANWSKGKALMEELQEKLGRYLQEYVEPQPAHGSSTTFSESQTFSLGSTDPQSVLLPLTEGCLTDNTGVPIIIVCTKSDHINNLEREMDYQEETFDYIQQSLRTICLKYGASLFYTSIHHPHTFAHLRQYILHRLLTPSSLNNPQQQPSSSPFKRRAQVVERDQVMVPAGWDSIGKIKVLRNGFDCEGVAKGWDFDQNGLGAQQENENGTGHRARTASGTLESARQVYEEVIINPKLNHAPVTIQPIITAEDDQVFLDRFFETLQKANERPGMALGGGSSVGMGGGSHGSHGSMSGPPVVGPLGSGYTSMLNSHHASSPPPPLSAGASSAGLGAGRGLNGFDADDVEGRLKHLTSKSKVNGGGSSSGLLGPSLTEAGVGGPGSGGLASSNAKMMMEQGRTHSGSPPVSLNNPSASLGGMAGSSPSLSTSPSVQQFFQSLMTRKPTSGVPPLGGGSVGATAATGTGAGTGSGSASVPTAATVTSPSGSNP